MVDIKSNFKQGSSEQNKTMEHIWICDKVNTKEVKKRKITVKYLTEI